MQDLLNKINQQISFNSYNSFWINLLNDMKDSINWLSIDNNSLINFISQFESINDNDDTIYWDVDFSKCLYELSNLNKFQLKIIKNFIGFTETNLAHDSLILLINEITRAKSDIEWLLKIEDFYQNLVHINQTYKLHQYEIIKAEYHKFDTDLKNYFIDLLSEVQWVSLKKNEVLNFLQGYDFFLLTNKAYYFVLPACMKVCIDIYRENKYPYSPTEHMSIFLNDKDRSLQASSEVKHLVQEFIKLLSNPNYFFLSFVDHNLNELIEVWDIKN